MACIGGDLLGQLFGGEARSRFLGHDGDLVPVQEKRRACRAAGVGRGPFIGADLIELQLQQRTQQILQVVIVFYFQCRAVVFPQTQLPGHGVKTQADFTECLERV